MTEAAGAAQPDADHPAAAAGVQVERVRAVLADLHRAEWGRVLASTARVAGSLDLAEECTQDAFVAALQTWPRDGVPGNPGAWLTTAAKRRALDAHRRDATLRRKLPLLVDEALSAPVTGSPEDEMIEPDAPQLISDDLLRLIFTCCHPALAREAQVALTLRLLCGVSTADIASAFLVSEPTMAARVTRAKKKIAVAGIPYRIPADHELTERLDAVLTVLHLLFTTGHNSPSGPDLTRPDLTRRAIALTRTVAELMPDEAEVRGLLALMLVTEARRPGRVDPAGGLVLLADQDRALWDRESIAEGHRLIVGALRRGALPGRFALQAAISALHAEAPTYAETDWSQVVALYDLLLARWPSPVVALNRAVAVSMASGPAAGLAAVDALATHEGWADQLAGYHYLPAARADLLRQLGRGREAAAEYRRALRECANDAERAFLQHRLETLPEATPSD